MGLGWGWGLDCYPQPFYGFGFGNYVNAPTYETPAYWYGAGDHDLVWLFMKDGTAYPVTDYWFVNGELHFTMIEDNPTKPGQHVMPMDRLNVQNTTYVNSARGFRMVMRDEPWQQYLKHHPEANPPELAPQTEN